VASAVDGVAAGHCPPPGYSSPASACGCEPARGLGLDRALATGADPSTSPLLAARAAQFADRRAQQRIAASLERLASTIHLPRRHAQTLPLPSVVRPNQDSLIEQDQGCAGDESA
jgi:hypothetical protein